MPADRRENRSPADGAKAKVGELAAGVRNALRELDDQHQAIAEHVDAVANAAKVAAVLTALGAAVAAPTGLSAVGVALGLVSAPLIVSVAPIAGAIAGVAITESAAASLYSRPGARRNQKAAHWRAQRR